VTTKTKIKQAHNHDEAQGVLFDQERAVARRGDPKTSKQAAERVQNIRASHRFVLHLFKSFGAMTDEQAWEAYVSLRANGESSLVPRMSPSGLRSRRAEVTMPRGVGLRDSGRRAHTSSGRNAVVWEIDA